MEGLLTWLSGLEKLKAGRDSFAAVNEFSELTDGERGMPTYGDMGERGIDSPLLDESFLGA